MLSILAMILIFVLGIQPPNDWALYITVGFFILTAIVWFGFENRRFQGPPLGDIIAKRQAAIARGRKGGRRDGAEQRLHPRPRPAPAGRGFIFLVQAQDGVPTEWPEL